MSIKSTRCEFSTTSLPQGRSSFRLGSNTVWLGGNYMAQNDYLLTEKPGKLVFRFALPCVLSLLLSALYNIVDQIFIGNSNVGTIGNTATSIVFPLTCIALAFGLLIGDGCAAYLSLCQGKKDTKDVSKAIASGFVFAFLISILMLVICFPFMDQVLSFFGAKTPESLAASKEYAFWIIIGLPFSVLSNAFVPLIRADGSPKTAMVATVTGCLINIVLDAVFIFPLNMGLNGAALATTIGIVATFLISFVYLFKPKTFKLKLSDFVPNFRLLWRVLVAGFSSFLTQISIVIISIVSMNMLAKYGAMSKYGANDPQAIIGVVMKVFTIFVNIAVGIAAGAQPIIGYNFGAKNYKRVKETYLYVLISTICVGVVATILFQTIPGYIIKIFGSNSANPELYIEFGEKAIRVYLMLIVFTLVTKTSAIFLQSIGYALEATLLSLIRDVISFVPLTVLLPLGLGLDGVLWAAPFADICGIAFAILFLCLAFKKMKKVEGQESQALQSEKTSA